jgi:hypothetical protein
MPRRWPRLASRSRFITRRGFQRGRDLLAALEAALNEFGG